MALNPIWLGGASHNFCRVISAVRSGSRLDLSGLVPAEAYLKVRLPLHVPVPSGVTEVRVDGRRVDVPRGATPARITVTPRKPVRTLERIAAYVERVLGAGQAK